VPAGIRGMDSTQEIYADSLKWFRSGWVDYFSPQLYWAIAAPEQSFPLLLKWWAAQNTAARHLWPGLSSASIGPSRSADEIIQQLQLTRTESGVKGSLQWSIKPLHQNRDGLADKLVRQLNQQPALVPASPWLEKQAPPKPVVAFGQDALQTISVFRWELPGGATPGWWLVQMRFGGQWRTELVPGTQMTRTIPGGNAVLPEVIAVTAVSRCGLLSTAFVAQR